jgi:hypothetical protein
MTGVRFQFKKPPRFNRENDMRYLNRLVWAVVVLGFAPTPALAQQGGGGGGQGGTGQGGTGQGGTGQGGAGQGGMTSGTPLVQLEQAPQITAPGSSTTGGGAGAGGADASNIFAATYGNPYYQGIPSNAKSATGHGGFGAVLYGTTGGAGGAGGTRGIGGAAGGRGALGGRAGAGGLGGANQSGVIVPLPVQISYPAIAQFPIAPVATSQLHADISGMIARTGELTNPAAVTVTVEKGIVTLRGTVKNIDEAKTIASMIRLTPGVRAVQNELTFAKQ